MIEDQLAPGTRQGYMALQQPAIEQGQVTAISTAGVVRQAFLQPQGIQKAVDKGIVYSGHWRSKYAGRRLRTNKK